MKTSLIKCEVGQPIQEISSGRKGILKDIMLKPNGMFNRGLVAVLVVHFEDGRKVAAISEKFEPVEDFEYFDSLLADGL